jgi:hypothetical protein
MIDVNPSSTPDPSALDPSSFRRDFNLLDFESEERQFREGLDPQSALTVERSGNEMPSLLIALPLHVVYYILEFMVPLILHSLCLTLCLCLSLCLSLIELGLV